MKHSTKVDATVIAKDLNGNSIVCAQLNVQVTALLIFLVTLEYISISK